MKRIDENNRTHERQPPGGAALAEAFDEGGLRPPFEPRLGEPARKLRNLSFGHGPIIVRASRFGHIGALS